MPADCKLLPLLPTAPRPENAALLASNGLMGGATFCCQEPIEGAGLVVESEAFIRTDPA